MAESSEGSSRYERKFLVDQLDGRQVQAPIKRHPGMFTMPYPPRYVNNLYLDSKWMDNYYDNVNGVSERQKVRIRWYGEFFRAIDKAVLEIKIKQGVVGYKRHFPLAPFVLDEHFDQKYWLDVVGKSELPAAVSCMLRDLDVVLANRYHRYYFATRDQRFRLTLDSEICYFRVKSGGIRFRHRQNDFRIIVVELKYGQTLDMEAQRMAAFFPFPVTKNSKYVTGIQRVFQ
jgi:hypothetical protein